MNHVIIEEMKRRIDALSDDEFEVIMNYMNQKNRDRWMRCEQQARNQMAGDILRAMFSSADR